MAVLTARAVVATLKLNDLANGLMVLSRESKSVSRVRAAALMAKMADAVYKRCGLQRNLNCSSLSRLALKFKHEVLSEYHNI